MVRKKRREFRVEDRESEVNVREWSEWIREKCGERTEGEKNRDKTVERRERLGEPTVRKVDESSSGKVSEN